MRKNILRLVSLVMLIASVIFILCALSAPTLGSVIYIGPFRFGPEQWRFCYAVYAIVMIGLFSSSFFIKDDKNRK